MIPKVEIDFNDFQALLRFGHGKLTDTCFMLLDVINATAAKAWLRNAPITGGEAITPPPERALQIAFSVEGLRVLGLNDTIINGFSDEFITGMSGDESRSRRLGDTGRNAPLHWDWGGKPGQVPHILLLLYARHGVLAHWRKVVEEGKFSSAFRLRKILPTDDLGDIEPFGFADGISQPKIDWEQHQSTDLHDRHQYSNWVAPGEFVLGYPNEYGRYTARPLIDPRQNRLASLLPDAPDQPALKDFGRNGTYLVVRQLHQDVPGFWQFMHKAAGADPVKREQLAASMVGRERDGSPLVPANKLPIAGIPQQNQMNHFTYEHDPAGHRCPVGSHIRRANPRTGDMPPGRASLIARLLTMGGFRQNRPDEDLIASTRFHRLLRRGRAYGPVLSPDEAVKPGAPIEERGLQFIALSGNLLRQFEFIQNAWSMNSKFGGGQLERDPILGIRESLHNGAAPDQFHHPDPSGPRRKTCPLPQFVVVRGGGYFFMPGLRAIQFIAAGPFTESDSQL